MLVVGVYVRRLLVRPLTQKIIIGWRSNLAPVIYRQNVDLPLFFSPVGLLFRVRLIQYFGFAMRSRILIQKIINGWECIAFLHDSVTPSPVRTVNVQNKTQMREQFTEVRYFMETIANIARQTKIKRKGRRVRREERVFS